MKHYSAKASGVGYKGHYMQGFVAQSVSASDC